MAAADIVTLTDEQLSDMRHVVEQFNEMRCDRMVIIRTSDVEIAGGLVVHVRYDRASDEFVVDL